MRYHNVGLRKRCPCPRRRWPTCQHSWHLNFKPKGGPPYRISLDREVGRHIEGKTEAQAEATRIRAAILAGTFRSTPTIRATVERPSSDARPTFAQVAEHYRNDPEGLARQSDESRQRHGYDLMFLSTVIVPPGVSFTQKPFVEIIRADIKQVLVAKAAPTVQTYRNAGSDKMFTRTVGGKVAANRLYTRLCALWNWA